jgi:YkoY family integral membrane protein
MLENLIAIATLVLLEGILSVDNALAMAMQVRSLGPSQQRRALFYGMWGALILRAAALLGAKWLMSVWWLQLTGALYLLYLAIAHFARQSSTPHRFDGRGDAGPGFWTTVAMVELTDAAFAFDSTLVAVGMSNHLWVILSGVAVGIVAVRFAASLFVKLLERCPQLEHPGFVLMGWVAVRLFSEGYQKMSAVMLRQPIALLILPDRLFWAMVAIIVAIGGALFLRGYIGNLARLLPSARRFAILIVGSIVLLVGFAMIFLPGPAIIVIPAGLAILATEFAWARSLLDRGKASLRNLRRA